MDTVGAILVDIRQGFDYLVSVRGANLCQCIVTRDPDYYSITVVTKQGDEEVRESHDYYDVVECVRAFEEIAAKNPPFILAQAHWLADEGLGEASVLLSMSDS
jgi:hypothetical protein